MPAISLSPAEAAALARYIDRHGIAYGPDGGLIEAIRNRLPAEPAPAGEGGE